jgi:hypothetical protein
MKEHFIAINDTLSLELGLYAISISRMKNVFEFFFFEQGDKNVDRFITHYRETGELLPEYDPDVFPFQENETSVIVKHQDQMRRTAYVTEGEHQMWNASVMRFEDGRLASYYLFDKMIKPKYIKALCSIL